MVIPNLDHPDIEELINWKMIEEQKVADLVCGSKHLNRKPRAIVPAMAGRRQRDPSAGSVTPTFTRHLSRRTPSSPPKYCEHIYSGRMVHPARQGATTAYIKGYEFD